MPPLVRDVLEVTMAVAVGGMLWSAVSRLRRGQLAVVRCAACGRTTSRAYERCPRCGAPQERGGADGGRPRRRAR